MGYAHTSKGRIRKMARRESTISQPALIVVTQKIKKPHRIKLAVCSAGDAGVGFSRRMALK